MKYPLSEKLLGKPQSLFGSPAPGQEIGWFYYAEDLEHVLEEAPEMELHSGWEHDIFGQPKELVKNKPQKARLILIEDIRQEDKDTAEVLLQEIANNWRYCDPTPEIIARIRKFLEKK